MWGSLAPALPPGAKIALFLGHPTPFLGLSTRTAFESRAWKNRYTAGRAPGWRVSHDFLLAEP